MNRVGKKDSEAIVTSLVTAAASAEEMNIECDWVEGGKWTAVLYI